MLKENRSSVELEMKGLITEKAKYNKKITYNVEELGISFNNNKSILKLSKLKDTLSIDPNMNSEECIQAASLVLHENSKSVIALENPVVKLCFSERFVGKKCKWRVYDILEVNCVVREVGVLKEFYEKRKSKLKNDMHRIYTEENGRNMLIEQELVMPAYFKQFKLMNINPSANSKVSFMII